MVFPKNLFIQHCIKWDWFQSKNKITFFGGFWYSSFKILYLHVHYSNRLNFSVNIPKCCKDVYVKNFFPCTARIQNSLPEECFPLTYNLNGFDSGVNRQLFSLGFFSSAFLYPFIFSSSFSCNVTPSLIVDVQPCMEWNSSKKWLFSAI